MKGPCDLRPYLAHGGEQIGTSGDEVIMTDPLTGKGDGFHVNVKKGLWHSKRLGKGGTLSDFLDFKIREYSENLPRRLATRLADDRGLPVTAFSPWDFGWDGLSYTIGIRNPNGAAVDIRRYRLSTDRRRMLSTPGCRVGLLGAHRLHEDPTAPVHVTEGEFDLVALAWLLNKVGERGLVVAVPGAGIFKPEWATWLAGRTVHTYYDNDDAGRRGELLAARYLLQRGSK